MLFAHKKMKPSCLLMKALLNIRGIVICTQFSNRLSLCLPYNTDNGERRDFETGSDTHIQAYKSISRPDGNWGLLFILILLVLEANF